MGRLRWRYKARYTVQFIVNEWPEKVEGCPLTEIHPHPTPAGLATPTPSYIYIGRGGAIIYDLLLSRG